MEGNQSFIVKRSLGKQPLAVVTGGAHRVGKMLILELVRMGYGVLIHCNASIVKAEQLKQLIFSQGGWAEIIQADLSQVNFIEYLFQKLDQIDRPLKVWVNAAAVMLPNDILHIEAAQWSSTMDLNLRAALLCSSKAAERMKDGGNIINISDYFAQQTWRKNPLYGLSKASLEHLTRILASRLAPGIRVNALALAPVLPPEGCESESWQGILSRSPGKRAITQEEIGRGLEYVLTNEYISGEVVSVTGDGKISIMAVEANERPA